MIGFFNVSRKNNNLVTSVTQAPSQFCFFHRMITGLDKLVEAAASVDILKQELVLKELEIKEATAKAEEVQIQIII